MNLAEARSVRWATRFLGRLAEHQVAEQATIIAFNIIYALFPLALSLAAIGGYVYRGGAARAELLHAVRAAFPAEVAKEMTDVITTAGSHSGLLGLIGFLSLFWAGSNLFTAIETSFARIFSVPPRGIVHQRLTAFLMILAFSALLVLSIAAANLAVLLGGRAGPGPGAPAAWTTQQSLGLLGGWAVAALMHLVLYAVVPNVRLPFRALWPGAVLAGTALQIVTLVFPLYIRYLAGINRFGDAFSLTFL
ncbi:MAG TPA: YihY/virulence factor BrkB family protein, partial [Gemmatimonadales bacterium]|nr:YihY/virulence factor BrkB family protein [Gemmatimonadales bacterium]